METSDRRPASHRRRFLIGLALAALLGAWLGAVLLAGSQQAERRDRAERRALIALSSLTAILDRTSGGSTTEAAPTETAQAPAAGGRRPPPRRPGRPPKGAAWGSGPRSPRPSRGRPPRPRMPGPRPSA